VLTAVSRLGGFVEQWAARGRLGCDAGCLGLVSGC
jgi:hypothetical protein